MKKYIARRLLLLIPNLFIIGTLLFFILRVMPGNVATALTSSQGQAVSPQAYQKLVKDLGLDRPLYEQYGQWIWQLLHGNLGTSEVQKRSVVQILKERFEVTLSMGILAVLFGLAVAIPLGVVSAIWRGSVIDQVARAVSAIGIAMPNFWVGILILLALVRFFNYSPPIFQQSFLSDPWAETQRIIFPALAIGFAFAAAATRLTRSTMLEVLNQDYVRTARAKGLMPFSVIIRHAMMNAVLPVLTLSSLLFSALLSGAVVLEQIFALPGMGQELISAVGSRDFVAVQGIVMALAFIVLLWILIIDISYALIDPRIRYE